MSRLREALSCRIEPVLDTGSDRISGMELAAFVPSAAVCECANAGVALSVREPKALLQALAALDGRVRAILLISPELAPSVVSEIVRDAGGLLLVSDRADLMDAVRPESAVSAPQRVFLDKPVETDWILTTSGTTGVPKMVRHRFEDLARTVRPRPKTGAAPIWGLLYEPTRFAGLQVVLQSLLGGGVLVAPPLALPISDRIAHMARAGVSHISATPTLWRRILMDPAANALAPKQITLGGEIADDAVLSALGRRFPEAGIRHIYASTETGVGFAVRDGRAGFPSSFLVNPPDGADLRVTDGRLWVRPPKAPPAPLGGGPAVDADGFVDTGDRVEVSGDRVRFLGRDTSAVNIGGTKVQPEEVERLINAHPAVALARVSVRSSAITGALLTLSVVPEPGAPSSADLKRQLVVHCREHLPREARPARITIAEPGQIDREISAAGKLARAPLDKAQ